MGTLFVIGTVWFWLLLALSTILIIWALEEDSGSYATITCLGTLAIIYFMGAGSELRELGSYIVDNPFRIVMFVLGYILLGTIWSLVKWYFHLLNIRDQWLENAEKIKETFSRNRGSNLMNNIKQYIGLQTGRPWGKVEDSEVTDALKQETLTRLDEREQEELMTSKEGYIPNIRKNKSRILMWMFYWPFSSVWTLVNDPIKRAFKHIFAKLNKVYESITKSVFDIKDED